MIQLPKHGSGGGLLREPRVDICVAVGVAQLVGVFARVKEPAHPICCVRLERHPGFPMHAGHRNIAWDTSREPLATFRLAKRTAIDNFHKR